MHLSGKDNMLPSRDEAWRLMKSLKNCNVRYFKDNGHTILLVGEDIILVLSEMYENVWFILPLFTFLHIDPCQFLLMQENGINLLTIIKGTSMYRRFRNHDYVMDFIPPSMSEFKQAIEGNE